MYCLIHYSEIGLKKGNRKFFEKKLIENIRLATNRTPIIKRGRLLFPVKKNEIRRLKNILPWIPGITDFTFCDIAELSIEDMKKVVVKTANKFNVKNFCIRTRRGNKSFKKTSIEINEILGEDVRKKTKFKVNLQNPELIIYVEIGDKAYIYTEKYKGMGGLPISSSGTLISFISGGIDSAVASFLMQKRGCSIVYLHFYNFTLQKEMVKDKVKRIVKVLQKHKPASKLYMVPFEELQRRIISSIPAKYRMLIYRRMMFRIGNLVAQKENAYGFVTGDSIGQVASQTIENLNAVYNASNYPVYTPLISMNKDEIVAYAKQIGTYELSILPYVDCCSMFVAKHPKTKSSIKELNELEKHVPKKLIIEAFKKARIYKV